MSPLTLRSYRWKWPDKHFPDLPTHGLKQEPQDKMQHQSPMALGSHLVQVDISWTLTVGGREAHGSLPCPQLPSDQAPPVRGATATTTRAPKARGQCQCTHNPRSFRKERARRQSPIPCIAPDTPEPEPQLPSLLLGSSCP